MKQAKGAVGSTLLDNQRDKNERDGKLTIC
jgi:hypothetical protein